MNFRIDSTRPSCFLFLFFVGRKSKVFLLQLCGYLKPKRVILIFRDNGDLNYSKSNTAALAHYSQIVCSKLTESLDHDTYTSLFKEFKRQISELETSSAACGEELMSS